ncbi:hypothetical protein [Microbacterium karelineae]|uniref:hypothetical protein n=1 Tax=Microbacterium karelineae TaxID=2654283 RepID=UPI0012E9F2FA|nr:hypothetical protein [Microbacterium karelineae]
MTTDFDSIDVDAVNSAAAQIRLQHPLPSTRLANMTATDAEAFLVSLRQHVDEQCIVIAVSRSGGRGWVEVELADGSRMSRSFVDSAAAAAIHCAYWNVAPIVSARIADREQAEVVDDRQERIDAGDLLALLGGEW